MHIKLFWLLTQSVSCRAGLYCDPHHLLDGETDLRFYQSLFYLGKFHELFDTVILVMRGKSPSFLQVSGHVACCGSMW